MRKSQLKRRAPHSSDEEDDGHSNRRRQQRGGGGEEAVAEEDIRRAFREFFTSPETLTYAELVDGRKRLLCLLQEERRRSDGDGDGDVEVAETRGAWNRAVDVAVERAAESDNGREMFLVGLRVPVLRGRKGR